MTNRKKLHSIRLALLILFFLVLGSCVVSAGTETQLVHEQRLVQSTAIYGNTVTWSESAGNGVHVYDLTAGKKIDIGTTEGNIPVYGNKILWGDWDESVKMYNLSTGEETQVTPVDSSTGSPDVYEDNVVYTKHDYSNGSSTGHYYYSLYLYDLVTHKETQITTSDYGIRDPAIYGNKIVWLEYENDSKRDIYIYDIPTQRIGNISTSGTAKFYPDIYGNIVVWWETHNEKNDIYMRDIAAHTTTQITTSGTASYPSIYGNRIVWQSTYYADDKWLSDIYMYDISTAKTTRITNSTKAFSPSIYGDKIVYADSRNHQDYPGYEVSDIYLYDLSSTVQNPPVAEFTANVTSGTAPLTVLFTDTSTGGVPTSWLWDTGDGIYSKHAMNATHTFTKPGNYSISLTVGNNVGNSTATKPGYIVVTDANVPVANFSCNVTEGYAPLKVQFYDISQKAASRTWDFNSDGQPDSSDLNPVYVYANAGTYTVNLTVNNTNGTASKTALINVKKSIPAARYAYITNHRGSNVSVIDTATNAVRATVDVGKYPYGVVVSPDGTKVYVANREDSLAGTSVVGTVSVIDTATNTVTATVDVGVSPLGIAISPDGTKVYVANKADNTVSVIDASTNRVKATVNVGNMPLGVAVNPTGTKVYVTNAGSRYIYSNSVSVIDTATNNVTANVTVGVNPVGIAFTPDGTKVYLGNYESNNVSVIDTARNTVTATVDVGFAPLGITVSTDGTKVYVANYGSEDVSVIDTSTNTVTATVDVGINPIGIAVTPDGTKVYVANGGSNNISIIDTVTNTITATVDVGDWPVAFGKFIYAGPTFPVANFSANVTSGYIPLSVLFTDLSENITSRTWDVGNDGTVESTDSSFVYVFSSTGTYPVSLTVNSENRTASKTGLITVLKESSSNGGSRGTGAGGSPEPAKNVEVKELSQASIVNGKTVKFDFTKNATCVVYVSFDAKKTAGKTTTIAEQLKAKSILVSNISSGEVYKSFNVWVGNSGFATEKNIENPVVCFKVEKSWLQDKNIDQNSITLNRYSDKKWLELPVKLLREDNKYLYFTAETPGFTHFVITGKAVEKEKVAETKPAADTSKLEQNGTAVSTTEQETGNGKVKNMPGFGMICGIVCLITVFRYKRK